MKLVLGTGQHDCAAASLAMVTGLDIQDVKSQLFDDLVYPFDPPWDKHPKVPTMDEICEWAWVEQGIALVPFNYNPGCSCGPGCNEVPVWGDADRAFRRQLALGRGLLEGTTSNGGHMCAWDGEQILDPRGYKYQLGSEINFKPIRFWLAI